MKEGSAGQKAVGTMNDERFSRRAELSGHELPGWFLVCDEGFQHDMQPMALQKIQADEFHSHAAAHMRAANDSARAYLALRRIEK